MEYFKLKSGILVEVFESGYFNIISLRWIRNLIYQVDYFKPVWFDGVTESEMRDNWYEIEKVPSLIEYEITKEEFEKAKNEARGLGYAEWHEWLKSNDL